jgi:hypothetical protein
VKLLEHFRGRKSVRKGRTVIIFWKLRENGTNVESSLGPLKTVCRKIVANVRFARIGPTVDALGLCTV